MHTPCPPSHAGLPLVFLDPVPLAKTSPGKCNGQRKCFMSGLLRLLLHHRCIAPMARIVAGDVTISLKQIWFPKTWALLIHPLCSCTAGTTPPCRPTSIPNLLRPLRPVQGLQAEGTGLPEAWPRPSLGDDHDLCCFRTRTGLEVEKARARRPCQCAKVRVPHIQRPSPLSSHASVQRRTRTRV